ncbi:MAG: tellurite methyltransferase [Planctomycetota bacterium]|jgi:tellurite methyltransferase
MQRIEEFLEVTKDRAPRETLVEALGLDWTVGDALDLGCGAGCDTSGMLAQGCAVTAVDVYPKSIQRTRERAEREGTRAKLTTIEYSFAALTFVPERFHLINAAFSLPFCHPSKFEELWSSIIDWLAPGGLLVCQLFGDRDEWAAERSDTMNFHSRERVDQLVAPLEVIKLEEEEKDGETSLGTPKHWHLFHCILRKEGSRE